MKSFTDYDEACAEIGMHLDSISRNLDENIRYYSCKSLLDYLETRACNAPQDDAFVQVYKDDMGVEILISGMHFCGIDIEAVYYVDHEAETGYGLTFKEWRIG